MARARFYDVARDPDGRSIASATVEVFDLGTTTPIAETLYADPTSGTTLTNPFTTATDGEFEFYLDEGAFVSVRYSKAGYTTETRVASVVAPSLNGTYVALDTVVVNVMDHGATGDGVADDTAEIQAAITAAEVAATGSYGAVVFFPRGTYRISSPGLVISRRDVKFLGEGSTYGSTINYVSTSGTCIKINVFSADVSDYTAGNNAHHFAAESIQLLGPYNATASGQTATSYGIVDYEAGSILLSDVGIVGFQTGFWGVASDINDWNNVLLNKNAVGVDLHNRSDQQTFRNLYTYGNAIAVRLNGITAVKFERCLFVDNVGVDVDICGPDTALTDPLGASSFTNLIAWASRNITFDTCWFEVYRDKNAGGAWAVGQPTKTAFVNVGVNSTTAQYAAKGVKFVNCNVVGIPPGGTEIAQCVVRQKYAVDTEIDGIHFLHPWPWPVAITEAAESYRASDDVIEHIGGVSVMRLSGPQSMANYHGGLVEGDKVPALLHRAHNGLRRSVITNPTLDANCFGWTVSGATPADYAGTASEHLLGSAKTITASSQFGGITQTGLRLRPRTAYEVVIRYRTGTGTGAWQLKLADSGGTPINNLWQRQLTPKTTLSEYRFVIPAYADTGPDRISLIALATPQPADQIIVDYLDVFELTPFEPIVKGRRRELYASAAPTVGTWTAGDVVWSTAPSYFMGWVCTAAGTPGTWKTFGTVDAQGNDHWMKPTAALFETLPRNSSNMASISPLVSGTLRLLPIALPAGQTISSVTFQSSATALNTGTNQWTGLFDSSRVLLAISPDATSGAWAANSTKTFTFGTPAVTTYDGMHFIGLMVAATTPPTLSGVSPSSGLPINLAPFIAGPSDTGQTTPPAIPFTAAAISSASGIIPYAYVS